MPNATFKIRILYIKRNRSCYWSWSYHPAEESSSTVPFLWWGHQPVPTGPACVCVVSYNL